MTPYPRRVRAIVDRAVRLGWEVNLSRPTTTETRLSLQETSGREYAFELSWSWSGRSWVSPRDQNIETVVEYLNRVEIEQEGER